MLGSSLITNFLLSNEWPAYNLSQAVWRTILRGPRLPPGAWQRGVKPNSTTAPTRHKPRQPTGASASGSCPCCSSPATIQTNAKQARARVEHLEAALKVLGEDSDAQHSVSEPPHNSRRHRWTSRTQRRRSGDESPGCRVAARASGEHHAKKVRILSTPTLDGPIAFWSSRITQCVRFDAKPHLPPIPR